MLTMLQILSSASVFGLTEDNHLVGTQYSWVSSIFYFGYLLYEYPTTILIQKLPVSKYLSGVTFIWGAVVATTAACTSFGGLATCRFLLGVAVRASSFRKSRHGALIDSIVGSNNIPSLRLHNQHVVYSR